MTFDWELVERTTHCVVAPYVCLAATWRARFLGLQLQPRLPAGAGLLLAPCRSIHTHFMRFTIDVVYLSGDGVVLATESGVRPWRIRVAPAGTRAVLELASGDLPTLPATGTTLALRSNKQGAAKKLPTALRAMGR